jgi:hypothetical protein
MSVISEEPVNPTEPEIPAELRTPSSFDVLFVGLVCFLNSGPRKRRVLLPNGTTPPNDDIEPHFPYVIVKPEAILDQRGWDAPDPVQEFTDIGMFRLPKCDLYVSEVDGRGSLDPRDHDAELPSLAGADPKVRIDEGKADAIARMTIGNGTLRAFRRPNRNEVDAASTDVAIVSVLSVEYDGEIEVKVVSDAGDRLLRLKPGTDVAIVNLAVPPDTTKKASHFPIYGALTDTGRIANNPEQVSPSTRSIPGDRYVFSLGLPINDGTSACGNQGCCVKKTGGG